MIRSRFAPSPTGPLHLGHAYSALMAHGLARRQRGQFILRIEDLDRARARPQWDTQITHDLAWLGIRWEQPIWRQSERGHAYAAALDMLWDQSLLYPCSCSRRDIQTAVTAPQEGAPLIGPDGVIYPGTCRHKTRGGPRPTDMVLRLDMARAFDRATLSYRDMGPTADRPRTITMDRTTALTTIGDPVIQRRDMVAYHLAVVVDDAAQHITHVVRGADLAPATIIHRVLQTRLSLPAPMYLHHDLIRDDQGKRLAKRHDAKALDTYRTQGLGPRDILKKLPPHLLIDEKYLG
ncbi:MAG: tRNA glutamyl-Q(34) synthetase GluQRS [Pseudomonadota bacterium]